MSAAGPVLAALLCGAAWGQDWAPPWRGGLGVAPDIPAAGPAPALPPAGLTLVRRQAPSASRGIELSDVLDVDPARFLVRTVSAQRLLGKAKATLPELLRAMPRAVAAINGGFFDREGTPVGLYLEDGHAYGNEHPTLDRVFFVRSDGRAGILGRKAFLPAGVVSAVSGKSAWPESDEPTARAAVCLARDGHVRLALAYPARTLGAMGAFLDAEGGCSRFVHLDGGGSVQFAVREGAGLLLVGLERRPECLQVRASYPDRCFRPVSNFLVVLPK